MDSVSIGVAFMAGIASFLSPCILPLVPAYITYLTGTRVAELPSDESGGTSFDVGTFQKALAFVFGFSTVFIALGASATVVGQLLLMYQDTFRIVAGSIIIVFGLHLTGLMPIPGLYREVRFGGKPKSGGLVGAFLLGMAFVAGWSPCVGPVLSAIYIYAATGETMKQGIALLGAFSAGLAVPFLITALSLARVEKWMKRFVQYSSKISMASGAVMVAIGFLILTDQMGQISGYLDFLPSF
ncbi:cytochrome c biogenesis protein CcdA [Heliobacillus mobilis]|uniref:Cytochrome c biogenesis protein CcdA n=1 Tax=Heliobacterium mobile TaxID=28064 RepID=A0A6I3SGL2_HELMO|nr:cytochrome c biogenesis protein CcdA [Heliobacterium mobile]MTV47955.1 cytochrome c biogenesis protein CcdA [Heliobacterium mobile]